MSGPSRELLLRRDKAKDTRIAELDAALLAFHDSPAGDVNALSMELEQVEAELVRLRKGLRLIIERPPGQSHRIAIQMLGAERSTP